MEKNKPILNTIENVNATDKGKFFPDNHLDIIVCHPPSYNNSNDRIINNWSNETEYFQWFRVFMNIVVNKLKKTGVFYLIGDIEELHPLLKLIEEFDLQLNMVYYFTKTKKYTVVKKTKDTPKTNKIIESVFVFTRNFQKKIKKILKLKQQELKLSAREINMQLSGNGNGGGYWSIYCGDNNHNKTPSEEHWNKFKEILKIDIDFNDINTQFRQYEGPNLWDDLNYEEDKLLSGYNLPVLFYERLIAMNRKLPADIVLWDPFCGLGNSVVACKRLSTSYYACELDIKTHYKANINIGNKSGVLKVV